MWLRDDDGVLEPLERTTVYYCPSVDRVVDTTTIPWPGPCCSDPGLHEWIMKKSSKARRNPFLWFWEV